MARTPLSPRAVTRASLAGRRTGRSRESAFRGVQEIRRPGGGRRRTGVYKELGRKPTAEKLQCPPVPRAEWSCGWLQQQICRHTTTTTAAAEWLLQQQWSSVPLNIWPVSALLQWRGVRRKETITVWTEAACKMKLRCYLHMRLNLTIIQHDWLACKEGGRESESTSAFHSPPAAPLSKLSSNIYSMGLGRFIFILLKQLLCSIPKTSCRLEAKCL